jgi:hypothetical protein
MCFSLSARKKNFLFFQTFVVPSKDHSSSPKNSQENEPTDKLFRDSNPDFKQSVKAETSDYKSIDT